jgi:hypothetical protein
MIQSVGQWFKVDSNQLNGSIRYEENPQFLAALCVA